LYNIIIEFGVPLKLIILTKIFLNATYNRVRIGTYLLVNFPFQNGLKGDA
jgi:hypothetical protein